MPFRPLAVLLLAALLPAAQSLTPEQVAQLQRERPVRTYAGNGRYMWHPAPGGTTDPVPALDDADRAALAKPAAKTWEQLVERFADRCAATYAAKAPPAPGLAAWFAAHPAQAREFWLALDPRFDDIAAALAVLEDLRAADAKRFEACFQLAVAMAVVWDQPDGVDSSRYYSLWAVTPAQFPKRMDMRQVWSWFSDPKRQGLLRFKPSELTWPIMVHLVDLAITPEDAEWAVQQKAAADIAGLYPLVPYDYQTLAGQRPKLGDQPYTLPDLRQFGGVCVDQAHFTVEMAKALGVPAMKCAGEGRWGGAGHAWAGYLQLKGGRALLEFTGRYNNDFYYTGEAFDPQTRTIVLDRHIALLYDGSSGGHATLVRARALARIATALAPSEPALAARIASQSIKANRYAADAWRTYFRVAARGELERKEVVKNAEQLFKDLAAHPDITIECLDDILTLFPADKVDARQGVYENAYRLYREAKRPDLQIQLRIRQSTELAAARREVDSLAKALETVVANSAEGSLVLPLVAKVVEDSSRFRTTVKGFNVEFVKGELAKAAKDFPKKRGNEVSQAWTEFQRLAATL